MSATDLSPIIRSLSAGQVALLLLILQAATGRQWRLMYRHNAAGGGA